METSAGGEDDVLAFATGETGPESFLNRFATTRGPEDLLHAGAPRLRLEVFEETAVGFHLDFGNGIVACQGDRREEITVGVEIVQSHQFENALPPALGVVSDVGDENTGSKIGKLSTLGSVVIGALAFRKNCHARRFCAEALGFRGFERGTKLVGCGFVSMGNHGGK